jgi:hypothetical protein
MSKTSSISIFLFFFQVLELVKEVELSDVSLKDLQHLNSLFKKGLKKNVESLSLSLSLSLFLSLSLSLARALSLSRSVSLALSLAVGVFVCV